MQQVATNAKRIWLAELQNSANLKKQFPVDSVFSTVVVSCRKWLARFVFVQRTNKGQFSRNYKLGGLCTFIRFCMNKPMSNNLTYCALHIIYREQM
jgi:hypothetical protein